MSPDTATAATTKTRWWILAFISLLMFGNYYVYDAVGPLADTLQQQLGFTDTQLGTLNAIYSIPNIFLVLVGGILVDRFGAARVTLVTTGICFLGALLTAARGDFVTMAAGRFLFGIGAETMLVATTVAIGLWFMKSNLALAMALSISIARAGSYTADMSPTWAASLYDQGWQQPLYLAAALAALSFVAALAYWYLEKRTPPPVAASEQKSDRIDWRHILSFNRSYWYILALCVLFYSVIFPFRSTFAIKYFQHAHVMDLKAASTLNSYVFLAAVFVTPAFGWIVDRVGRRALFMVFGSLLLPLSFLILATTSWNLWVTTVLIGISFSLIPAVLWPSVALLVQPKHLGTAYGLMFMLQNIGMAGANLFAGHLNDRAGASAENPEGYLPMLLFFGVTASIAFAFAIMLRIREAGPHGHGLETFRHTDKHPAPGLV
jgi:MFS family permease